MNVVALIELVDCSSSVILVVTLLQELKQNWSCLTQLSSTVMLDCILIGEAKSTSTFWFPQEKM